MRFSRMMKRGVLIAAMAALSVSLAACKREEPDPAPEPSALPSVPPGPGNPYVAPGSGSTATSGIVPNPDPPATSAPSSKLDMTALSERRDPDRVLRFYVNALQTRQWAAAARAWGAETGVTAAMLKSAYDRSETPRFELGKGTVEGAAGSLYYEAPVVLRFGGANARPERGTLILRRVNDVDGASREQLRWHIEKSTIGMGQ